MTLHRALKPPKDATALRPAAKTNRSVCWRQLEKLLLWIAKCEELQLPAATGTTIREKAARIREKIVAAAPQTASKTLMAMAFFNGWLCKFQICHNVTSKRVHGEAAFANMDAVDEGRAFLQRITSGYARHGIFNFDEMAYFYCTPPSKTISARPVSGRKNAKKRITVAVACNADGTMKLPLLFVGTSKQPRCLGGKSSAELGFDYASRPKSWMNTQLFQSWVSQFNESMKDENRRVLLLLDNASSHRMDEPLSNVKLQMLPSNTTAFLQSRDADIIRQFKAQLSKYQARHALDCLDEVLDRAMVAGRECASQELDKLYNVDVLNAMRWAREA